MFEQPVIVLDADGVMIEPWRFRDRLSREFGIEPATTAGFFRGPFVDCTIGRADLRACLAPYLDQWGWTAGVEAFLDFWFDADGIVDTRMWEAIGRLRAAGYRCCLATNQEAVRAEHLRSSLGFASAFDDLFISCEMGCKKPDASYFEGIARRLGVRPAGIAFWDDSQTHVAAARDAGWNARLFSGYDAFADEIAAVVGPGIV